MSMAYSITFAFAFSIRKEAVNGYWLTWDSTTNYPSLASSAWFFSMWKRKSVDCNRLCAGGHSITFPYSFNLITFSLTLHSTWMVLSNRPRELGSKTMVISPDSPGFTGCFPHLMDVQPQAD